MWWILICVPRWMRCSLAVTPYTMYYSNHRLIVIEMFKFVAGSFSMFSTFIWALVVHIWIKRFFELLILWLDLNPIWNTCDYLKVNLSVKLNSRNKSSNHKLKSLTKIKLILLKNNKHIKINFTYLKSSLTLKTKDM